MVAPWILWRYILRDVLLYTSLGLTVFSLLLMVQNTLRFLEELLGAGVGLRGFVQLMGLILPSYLAYVLPTSLLMGVLLSFGRMSADGEIIAMRAAGVSVKRLLPPIFALSAVAALLTGYLLFELEPRSHQQMRRLVREMARAVQVAEPGKFRKLGQRTLYVHQLGDETCTLEGVLIADFSDPRRSLYIAARCGLRRAARFRLLWTRRSEGCWPTTWSRRSMFLRSIARTTTGSPSVSMTSGAKWSSSTSGPPGAARASERCPASSASPRKSRLRL